MMHSAFRDLDSLRMSILLMLAESGNYVTRLAIEKKIFELIDIFVY